MYIENMNRKTQTQKMKKKTHARETHTHNEHVYTTYIPLPWCVRGTLFDRKLERESQSAR
jgi:hypothetical protein